MNILVLAGSSDQAALIIELKKRKNNIILVDYLQNPIAKRYVDKHFVTSTLDIDSVRDIAIREKVDLITTACTDQALLTAAKISEEIKLPCYISYQTALNVTNKSYMKEILSKNDIPTAKYIISDATIPKCINDFTFPLVVKPVDCNSSKGVRKVISLNELKEYLHCAVSMSRSETAIIEEYKNGEEISADFYIQNGIVKLLLVTGSYKIQNSNSFTILQSYYPAVSENEELTISNIAQKIACAFNLVNTPMLLQLIKTQNSFYVIEFSARIGGGSKYKLIEKLTGVNIMNVYIDLIMGLIPHVSPEKRYNHALMNYVYCNPGLFHELQNFETLKETHIIDDFFHYKTGGMEIINAEISSDRAAGFLILGNDKHDVISRLCTADKELKVIDQNGNDIMKHGLYAY